MWNWSDGRQGAKVWLLACGLLVAPALAIWNGWSYAQLVRDGATVSGTVVDKTQSGSRRPSHYVHYVFRDAAGRRHWARQRVWADLYARTYVGQPVDVVHIPGDPAHSVAFIDALREQVAFMSFVSLAIGVLVGGTTWWWIYACRKTREHDAGMMAEPAPDGGQPVPR